MSGKSIIFDHKKINKSAIKYWFLRRNHVVKEIHLNTLLDMMIMMI